MEDKGMNLVPNILATLVGGAIYWVIGGLWYAAILGKPYQTALGFGEEQAQQVKKSMPLALSLFLISGILSAYVIGRIVLVANAATFLEGMIVGLWIWVGFGITIVVNLQAFEHRPKPLLWINGVFYLIAFPLVGGIMAIWE
jgi:F0F1-type ATP synthase assembly protein I